MSSPNLNHRSMRFTRASPHQATAAIPIGMKPIHQLTISALQWQDRKNAKPVVGISDRWYLVV
jgi:hypothetical protein